MYSLRIREIEDEIRGLERELYDCNEKHRDNIRRKIDNLKSELRRLKRREEEEEEDEDDDGIIGIGLSLLGLGLRGFGSNGSSHGFGGGGFGGGGSGESW